MSRSEKLERIALSIPKIVLPNEKVDLKKWAVVACDQFTSNQKYWQDVENYVGSAPSTLRLMYPEAYLEESKEAKENRIKTIKDTMQAYIDDEVVTTLDEGFVLVRRESDGLVRYGLMVALDLEAYDYSKDSKSKIRATEGTILSRIPPRVEIRSGCPLELPHILVLLNDKDETVIEPLIQKASGLKKLYDIDLMKNGGNVRGYYVHSEEDINNVVDALDNLLKGLDEKNPLLYAMGDGNHSFATAKACWENIKKELSEEEKLTHPSRYCLVELENIFDKGLEFEPIHRVFFNCNKTQLLKYTMNHVEGVDLVTVDTLEHLEKAINVDDGLQHCGLITKDGYVDMQITNSDANIAPGTIQFVIDEMAETNKDIVVDYIHGIKETAELGEKQGNLGLILPDVSKDTFFETVLVDGALPRKTFSMGEAHQKRYYLEARELN